MSTESNAMNHVTNVILTCDTYDDDKLEALNALPWCRGTRGLVSCDFDKENTPGYAWYGGYKYLTMGIWIGAFSDLVLDELVSAIRQIEWNEPQSVRLHVSAGERGRFARIDWNLSARVSGSTPAG